MKNFADIELTELDSQKMLAYHVKSAHMRNADFLADLGYAESHALDNAIFRLLKESTDEFVKAEDEIIFGKQLPRNVYIPSDTIERFALSRDEYSALVHPNPEKYQTAVKKFAVWAGVNKIGNNIDLLHGISHKIMGHYTLSSEKDRSFFHYNTELFDCSVDAFKDVFRKSMSLSEESERRLVMDLDHLVRPYSDIVSYKLR